MASYPNTGSILDSRTHTLLSTQIIVKVDGIAVGAIQDITPKQARTINRIAEIGTDGFIESVPSAPTTVDLDVNRIAFDRLRITEAFGRGFFNIQSQRIPFDIEVHENQREDSGQVYVYHQCWFNSVSTPYKVDNYIVTESASITCTWVDILHPADGGERGIPFKRDPIEAATDLGQRLGSLDAAGLIDAAFNQ